MFIEPGTCIYNLAANSFKSLQNFKFNIGTRLERRILKNIEIGCKSFGVKVDFRDNDGKTALHHAVIENNVEVTKLLAKKLGIRVQDDNGKTVFHYAVELEDTTILKLFLKKIGEFDIDINSKDNNGQTVLHYVAMKGNKAILDLFFDKVKKFDIDINAKDNEGQAACHYIAKRNDPAILELFCNKAEKLNKFDINIQDDKEGKTLLHCVAEQGNLKSIKICLKRGANPDILDSYEKKPLGYVESGLVLKVISITETYKFSKNYNPVTSLNYEEFNKTLKRPAEKLTKEMKKICPSAPPTYNEACNSEELSESLIGNKHQLFEEVDI